MLDLLREQEKTSFPSRESSFSGWEQSAVSSTLTATIRVSDNFGSQTNVTSSRSIALQTNLRNGLFVSNNPALYLDPDGKSAKIVAVVVVVGISAHGIFEIIKAASKMAEHQKSSNESLSKALSDPANAQKHFNDAAAKKQEVGPAALELANTVATQGVGGIIPPTGSATADAIGSVAFSAATSLDSWGGAGNEGSPTKKGGQKQYKKCKK